jgi:hypothetical protein
MQQLQRCVNRVDERLDCFSSSKRNILVPRHQSLTATAYTSISLYLDNFGASNTNPQPPTPETSYFSNDIQDTPSYYYTSNIELFIPNAQAGPSDPRSASGASITYNQLEHIDASSYVLRYAHPLDSRPFFDLLSLVIFLAALSVPQDIVVSLTPRDQTTSKGC